MPKALIVGASHGLADIVEQVRGRPGSRFLDHTGAEIAW